MDPAEADRLCNDLLGVLIRIASAQGVLNLVECEGCGSMTDPDSACPTCRAALIHARKLRARRAA
jgi:hypothetical protein